MAELTKNNIAKIDGNLDCLILMKRLFAIALAVLCLMIFTSCRSRRQSLPDTFGTRQVVVVTTPNWTTTSGTLSAYEWVGNHWRKEIGPIQVTLGRSGMAWGEGLHDSKFNRPPMKTEGDGKSPAGIYTLDSLYGYDDLTTRMDYMKVDANTFCVDDPQSKYYNQIVRGADVEKDWKSAEVMRLSSDAYKYGIVVGYNRHPATPGKGSCIFYHIGPPDGTTAGCTAMSEHQILRLIQFLDKSKKPLIVQAPVHEYAELAGYYSLPES